MSRVLARADTLTAAMPRTRTKPRTVAVVTGSRAEFGLLRPVMDAIAANKHLRLRVVAAGSHMLPPARTIREVEAAYTVAARVPMPPTVAAAVASAGMIFILKC